MWRTLTARAGCALSAALACALLTSCSLTSRSDFGMSDGDVDRGWIEPSENEASVDSVEVVYMWTPPTTGTPVAYYECDWAHGQTDIRVRNKSRFVIPDSTKTRLRVRGVDASDRSGPYSSWSKFYPERDAAGDTIDVHDHDEGEDGRWQR